MSGSIVSSRFPYLSLTLTLHGRTETVEALIDTGFEGDVVLPADFVGAGHAPESTFWWILADGSRVQAPGYFGAARVGHAAEFVVAVSLLGREPIVGRGVIDRFTIILDHGQRVIIEV